MKLFVSIFLLLSSLSPSAQEFRQVCDSLSQDDIRQFDSYSSRKLNTFKKKKNNGTKLFLIATYLRQKGDTTYKEWYQLFIYKMNNWYSAETKHDNLIKCLAIKLGISYFYLEDYKNAHTWLEKVQRTGMSNQQLEFYLAETAKKIKQ